MRGRLGRFSMVAICAVFSLAPPALANGGNYLDVDDRSVAVGQSLVVKNRYFSRSDVARGPYFAYLLVNEKDYGPPRKVFRNAPVLGRVQVLWPPEEGWRSRRMAQNPVLVGHFTVPDVTPGQYLVHICDRPCTHVIDGVGPTMIRIATTPEGARLHERVDALKYTLVALKSTDRRSERRVQSQLQDELEAKVDALEADLAAARRLPHPPSRPSAIPIWIAIGLGSLAMTLSLLTLRRTRRESTSDWDALLAESPVAEKVSH